MRSVGLIAKHIEIYWLNRDRFYSRSNQEQDAFLADLKNKAQDISAMGDIFTPKLYDEHSLKKLYDEVKLEINALKELLLPAITKALRPPQDEQYLKVLYAVLDNIETTENHIHEINTKYAKSINRFRYDAIAACGGVCVTNLSQALHPFSGKTYKGNEGFCGGLVYAWAHKKNVSDALIAQSQEISTRSWYNKETRTREFIENIQETISKFNFKKNVAYNLDFELPNYISHAIGMRKCNGIDEYEIFDPNFGTFRFKTQKDAGLFLKILALEYCAYNPSKFSIYEINELNTFEDKIYCGASNANPAEHIKKTINYMLLKIIKSEHDVLEQDYFVKGIIDLVDLLDENDAQNDSFRLVKKLFQNYLRGGINSVYLKSYIIDYLFESFASIHSKKIKRYCTDHKQFAEKILCALNRADLNKLDDDYLILIFEVVKHKSLEDISKLYQNTERLHAIINFLKINKSTGMSFVTLSEQDKFKLSDILINSNNLDESIKNFSQKSKLVVDHDLSSLFNNYPKYEYSEIFDAVYQRVTETNGTNIINAINVILDPRLIIFLSNSHIQNLYEYITCYSSITTLENTARMQPLSS